ncbi:MAG: ATP-binding cassette domain-containing protein [Roseburia inulinivorans]
MDLLSIGQMQSVEIAKAVSHQAKVVIFDEPTSSLSDNEVEALFRIMNDLRDKGVAMVYISHKMDEIKRIADDITSHAGWYICWNLAGSRDDHRSDHHKDGWP